MLTLLGRKQRFCDGLSRRNFLRIGGLALGGMSMPQILRAEAEQAVPSNHKAIIMVFLAGGPPHLDMWDLKPDAPAEYRGEFSSIDTNVPGIQICELFPRLAGMMDKLAIIRSLVGSAGDHASHICFSGYGMLFSEVLKRPSLGAFLSRIQGPVDKSVPPFVGLSPKTGHAPWGNPGEYGFVGAAHAPFQPQGQGMADMVLKDMPMDRLADRKALLAGFDRFRSDADASGMMEGMDAYTRRAFEVLTSNKLVKALDLSNEDPAMVERYGKGNPALVADGSHRLTEQFLIARRLVEAGVRCVTLAFSRWDWHGGNFTRGRQDMPMLDRALASLIEDLHQRGLDQDVSVVVWGEFGRTPRINKDAGRDHWPPLSSCLLAGGGMRTGQVIGASNRLGETPVDRPVHYQNVFATLYRQLGLDPATTTVPDLRGRPQYLLDIREPIEELV